MRTWAKVLVGVVLGLGLAVGGLLLVAVASDPRPSREARLAAAEASAAGRDAVRFGRQLEAYTRQMGRLTDEVSGLRGDAALARLPDLRAMQERGRRLLDRGDEVFIRARQACEGLRPFVPTDTFEQCLQGVARQEEQLDGMRATFSPSR